MLKENNNNNNNNNNKNNNEFNPSDIKGKIDVKDTRKRKDGPGGN